MPVDRRLPSAVDDMTRRKSCLGKKTWSPAAVTSKEAASLTWAVPRIFTT